ncbi:MAG: sulfatase-like hydrolase/transferase, partial [Planctomycetes bacterium]|nr:sulfatase-like hydrolase/transferase [Planctomycetota bacterium]
SDNGPVINDGYVDQAEELLGDHKPAGPLRGGKYSLFDGGTRVPFIVSWPGTIEAGESHSLVSQLDFHASFAALCGQVLQDGEAEDSENVLDAFLNKATAGRDELVVEGMQAKTVMRQGDWAYIPAYEGPLMNEDTNTELGNADHAQLYDLSGDIGQITDVAEQYPDVVNTLSQRLAEIKQNA